MEQRLLSRINDARAAYGKHRLRIGRRLQRGADSWSRYLLSADSFYHARLAAGTGENMAWGTCSYVGPAKIVKMWLNSPAHRVNLLRTGASRVGVGWAVGRWRGYGCVKMAVARFR
jgi:uncharacterized protein YkwD